MPQRKKQLKKQGENKGQTQNIKKGLLIKHVIEVFYKEGLKTISELCEITNNSIPSMTNIMTELTEKGLVRNFGIGESKGGRKPSLYGLNPSAGAVVAIEINRKSTRLGVFDLHNKDMVPIKTIDCGMDTPENFFTVLKEESDNLLKETNIDAENILGYGVTLPGLIDMRKGLSYSYELFGNKPISEPFEKIFHRPVFVEHDTKAMALGESSFGLAKHKSNVLFINIGTGIGMGIIIDNKLYQGKSGFCGEFGHITIIPNGELCHCGKIGCIETVASGSAMVKKTKQMILNGKNTIIIKDAGSDIDKISLSDIISAANQGDLFAIEIIEEAGEHLAKGISILLHLFNPEAIIIGGEMANAGNLITDPIQQKLNKYAMLRLKQDTEIILSELKEKAGMMGTLPIVVSNTIASELGNS